LAHAHLLNASRCYLHSVQWPDQQLSFTALAANAYCEQWVKYIKDGMRVKVLRWDTPEWVAEIISNARNKTKRTNEWTTMLQLIRGVTAANAELATAAVYNQYRRLVNQTLGRDVADSPLTTQLIELVHQYGPNTKFVDELTKWAEKCVNSKKRQGSADMYKVVNSLPNEFPFIKTAIIKRQYSSPPVENECHTRSYEGLESSARRTFKPTGKFSPVHKTRQC